MSSAIKPPLMPAPPGPGSILMMSNLPTKLPPIQAPPSQGPYHPANPYESSSTTTTLSPRSPNGTPGNSGLVNPPRSSDARPYPPGPGPPVGESVHRYGGDYDPMMVSPPGYDQYRGPRMDMMGGSPHSVPGHLQQKRAYRQRRKDPSCDACRERKVKCDATDTSSCSECSSRNVKCQFTKETNRRMSSIKQVQDLEKQLHMTKQQLSQYESILKTRGIVDTEAAMAEDDDSQTESGSPSKKRKLRPTRDSIQIPELDARMTQSLRDFSRADIKRKLLSSGIQLGTPADWVMLADFSELPFTQQNFVIFEAAKATLDSKPTTPTTSSAIVAGCIACSALRNSPTVSDRYHQVLVGGLDTTSATLDTIRALLLSTIYLSEVNRIHEAFTQIALAVSVAQTLGLQRQIEISDTGLRNERRALWTAVASLERSMSLEYGRPSLIQDSDMDSNLKDDSGSDDARDRFNGLQRVAKIATQVHAARREDVIPVTAMANFDQSLPLNSDDGQAAPRIPWGNLHMLSALLIIHRHHINPFVTDEVRRSAAKTCTSIAYETVRNLEAARQRLETEKGGFLESLRAGPVAKVIRHLWRCVLLCLYAGDVQVAQECGQILVKLAESRPIGRYCGQYLAEYINIWKSRITGGIQALMADAKMITYTSADVQASHQQAWVPDVVSIGAKGESAQVPADEAMVNGISGDQDTQEWNGWSDLLDTLTQLPRPPPPAPMPADAQAVSGSEESHNGSRAARVDPAVSASNRLKIADLMG